MLSKKLDAMLEEAKIDSNLMDNLAKSIKSFEAAAEGIAPTADSIRATQKYSEELNKAASQMESLNQLYQNQLDSAQLQANVQSTVAQNAEALQKQMEQLSKNLTTLNEVYEGMLSAMNRKSN
jgi:gliding motility-associated protein GldL